MTAKPKKNLLTRKDLAQIIGISVDQFYRNETRWGFSRCRADLNARCIRFRTDPAWEICIRRGWV